MTTFAIVVRGNPVAGQSSWSALRFCEAAVAAGHTLVRVFFHGEGADCANTNRVMPQDESDLLLRWQNLHAITGTDFVVCVSSALKRGILDQREAQRSGKLATLAPFMSIGGLGQLVEATTLADRVVSFHD